MTSSTTTPDRSRCARTPSATGSRILEAAAEVFGERGLGATLDAVAERAGVGVGTVYRRFPDKEALVDALFEERIDAGARRRRGGRAGRGRAGTRW